MTKEDISELAHRLANWHKEDNENRTVMMLVHDQKSGFGLNLLASGETNATALLTTAMHLSKEVLKTVEMASFAYKYGPQPDADDAIFKVKNEFPGKSEETPAEHATRQLPNTNIN